MSSRRFERIVLGLPQGAGARPAVEAAANLAEFLRIELIGAFVADARLQALTGLPGRELRMLDLQWQPIDFERMSRELEHAAAIARARFAEIAGGRAIKTSFDVISGVHVMGSLIRAHDIVAIVEPARPGESITQQFSGLLDAASQAAAAVLVVPKRILCTSGPVLAVAESREHTSLRVALEIAAALKERLFIATGSSSLLPPEILAEAGELGVRVDQIAAGGAEAGALVGLAPARLKERLRVISRSRLPSDLNRLFAGLHGVPLLVVEPDRLDLPAMPEE